MDPPTIASSLVYLGTGVMTTITHQVLVYQGAGAPSAMLVPFFNYFGMSLVELIPESCGGLDSGAGGRAKKPPGRRDGVRMVVADGDDTAGQHHASDGGSEADSSGGAAVAAAAAGAPAVRGAGAADAVVLCPTGARTGPCLPSPLRSVLSRPLPTWSIIVFSVLLDLAGFTAGSVGVSLAGSGVYQVVHASVIVFAALFAWLLRGRNIRTGQWGAIALIVTGLAISAAGAGGGGGHGALEEVDADGDGPAAPQGAGIGLGIAFTLLGAVLYGLNYSLLDALSSAPTAPPQARLAASIGSWAATAVAVWMVFVTIPTWDDLVGEPTKVAGGDPGVVLTALALIGVSALTHSLAYFRLLRGHGAVVIGVLQALRAAAVFLVGSALFCGYQESQCLTAPRAVAALLVAIGVVIFASSKARVTTTPAEG